MNEDVSRRRAGLRCAGRPGQPAPSSRSWSPCPDTPGELTHILDTAAQHDPMSWAVVVCIDLPCVMAARERHPAIVASGTGAGLGGIMTPWPHL